MSTSVKPDHYVTLVNDITELYNRARHALVESYWQIGRLIVEQEQHGETGTVYAKELIERLSEDLTNQLGSGFSERNLYKMRKFYLANKVLPTSAKLTWSQHVELLPVTNEADKQQLERQIHTIMINTHDTWQMSFTHLTARTPQRPTLTAST